MILILSAGRKESVEEIIDEIAYPFEYKNMSIASFAAESMQSLGHIKILVCDLDSLPDRDDSIVQSLSKIQNLYMDMNIVLITFDGQGHTRRMLLHLPFCRVTLVRRTFGVRLHSKALHNSKCSEPPLADFSKRSLRRFSGRRPPACLKARQGRITQKSSRIRFEKRMCPCSSKV